MPQFWHEDEAKVEQICRVLCQIRKLDPEEMVNIPVDGKRYLVHLVPIEVPRWKTFRSEVISFIQVKEAIARGPVFDLYRMA